MASSADHRQALDPLRERCPVRAALDVLRGRWKPSILLELKTGGTQRFSDLQAGLRGVSPQALTVQLRQLEADGVVTRIMHPEIPPRVEYTLSDFGRSLSDVMDRLEEWGLEYQRRQKPSPAAPPARARR